LVAGGFGFGFGDGVGDGVGVGVGDGDGDGVGDGVGDGLGDGVVELADAAAGTGRAPSSAGGSPATAAMIDSSANTAAALVHTGCRTGHARRGRTQTSQPAGAAGQSIGGCQPGHGSQPAGGAGHVGGGL